MKNIILARALLISSLGTALFAHGGEPHNGENFLGYGGMMGGGAMGFGWLIPLILVIVFGYLIYNSNRDKNGTKNITAKDILDERFANGEIDEKEYKEKISILKG